MVAHLRVVFLLLSLALLPAASAHDLVEASELETLFLVDELSDVVTSLPGYGFDLGEFYVGEAHVPGIGDGLYVRTLLYATEPGPSGHAASVVFEFGFDEEAVTRTLSTQDGQAFTSDFDALVIVPGSTVDVTRAFLAFGSAGVQQGQNLTSLRVRSVVDGEDRDVAPGGFMAPGPAGAAGDVPDPSQESRQVVQEYPLVGPTRYIRGQAVLVEPGKVEIRIQSLLKEGAQHVMPGPMPAGANLTLQGHVGSLAPGANTTMTLQVGPDVVGAFSLNITTDLGGRMPVLVHGDARQFEVSANDGEAVAWEQPQPKESPAASVWLLPLLAGLALAARRHRRVG
jgi:hypothetical protein